MLLFLLKNTTVAATDIPASDKAMTADGLAFVSTYPNPLRLTALATKMSKAILDLLLNDNCSVMLAGKIFGFAYIAGSACEEHSRKSTPQ